MGLRVHAFFCSKLRVQGLESNGIRVYGVHGLVLRKGNSGDRGWGHHEPETETQLTCNEAYL